MLCVVGFAGRHRASMLLSKYRSARLDSTLAQKPDSTTVTMSDIHRRTPSTRWPTSANGLGRDSKTLWKSVEADFPKPFSKLLKLLACGPSPGPTTKSGTLFRRRFVFPQKYPQKRSCSVRDLAPARLALLASSVRFGYRGR